jgi:hypothetical protein
VCVVVECEKGKSRKGGYWECSRWIPCFLIHAHSGACRAAFTEGRTNYPHFCTDASR